MNTLYLKNIVAQIFKEFPPLPKPKPPKPAEEDEGNIKNT